MIFITVKFQVKDEYVDSWLQLTSEFTAATRNEPGNLWFDWSRSVDDPHEFVLVEAFRDGAGGDHVQSAHFQQAMKDMLPAIEQTPKIINFEVPGEQWSTMGELEVQA